LKTKITQIDNHRLNRLCFSQLGVLGKLCSESELSPQRLAFVHKAIEMAFFRSWLRTVRVRRGVARIYTNLNN